MTLLLRYTLAGILAAVLCCIPHTPPQGDWRDVPVTPVRVRMLFAGDLMQHMPQVTAARRGASFDYSEVFAALRPRFDAADLVVVNLETTLTRSRHYTGYPCFRSPAALAGAMREAGIDVAVMANNHCCDSGAAGVRTTTELLDSCGIMRTGVFMDSVDYVRHNPLYLKRRGICFALLNYTYGTNGMPVPQGVRVNEIDTLQIASDLYNARIGGAQSVVVCIHWGVEYQRRENEQQLYLAEYMRRHGADVVVGSHPHVIQPYEATRQGVVFYSLGNFVSNQRQRYTDGGVLAQVDLVRYPDGRIEYTAEALPVWVALPDYRVIPPEVGDTMALPAAYRRFREDAAQLLGTAL